MPNVLLKRFNGTSWEEFLPTPATHIHGVADINAAKNGVFYVEGNTTGTAGTWTGANANIPSYYDGLTVAFKIGIDGAGTTTLNINGFGAKTVRRNTGLLTTHLPVNSVVILTLTTIATVQYWVWSDYDSTDPYVIANSYYQKIGADPIYQYKIVMEGPDGLLYPLTLPDGTGTTKTVSTREFRFGAKIYGYRTTATLAANSLTRQYMAEAISIDGRYTFNSVAGFVQGLPIYLRVNNLGNGKFTLFQYNTSDYSSFYTQSLPTSVDEFCYIRLGVLNDTAGCVRIETEHPIYYWDNGALRLYTPEHVHAYQPTESGKGLSTNDFTNALKTAYDSVADRFQAGISSKAVASCDTIVTSGMYYVNPNDASRPTGIGADGSTDYNIISIMYSVDWGTQYAGDFRTNRAWVRNKNNGTWNSWVLTAQFGISDTATNSASNTAISSEWAFEHETLRSSSLVYGHAKISVSGSTLTITTT